MVDDFVITRVGWLSGRPGMPPEADLRRRFFALVSFLQQNRLTKRQIASDISDVTKESELRSTDLTDEGLRFLRRSYEKWSENMDVTHDYDDTNILRTELEKMRSTRT